VKLVVIPGMEHIFARDHPEPVAAHVLRHLAAD
jgi:pimeloyl-ACP methyl ester carboxylesterase